MNTQSDSEASIPQQLRSAVDQAETLLDRLAREGDGNLAALRERVQSGIGTARARIASLESAGEHARETAAAAFERWSRQNPWSVLAIGAGVGLLIGIVLGWGRPASRSTASGSSDEQ